ncbi:disease resistance protein At4g27190-like isoform X2 [Humulus lupulus]|nr:disease resistance protein At4g27190-like isoform X2 [Humulus lupulus]XP_062076307.1 disease resistance protein At4g27190-like isoform X2 [Humulus lupulus]XP_062076308.1 disease resistance protein At4g27190-like isoform X2 [Humulus lupulus]
MEIAISIAGKIAEYTVAPVGRQLGYLFHYTSNVDNLKTQMQDLKDARERLQHRVEEEINNCQEIENDVRNWLSSVEQISEKVDTFLNQEDHAKVACFSCGSVFHLVTRHQLSRKAKKVAIVVLAISEKNKFGSIPISYCPQTESSFQITKGYETFESRKGILKDIMVAVRDANRSRIGLYGMGGIGKTMLAKEIARRAEEEKLFSKVVMTTISQTPNIEEIQQEIAEMLDIKKFGEIESTSKRAYRLRQRLKQETSIMLILDDVWKELDLEVIGIPDECKMLLTSRSLDVLCSSMDIVESNNFSIKALDSRESISMFKKIIGEKVEKPDYNDLAHKIVGECAGLPIAIATVARALKYKKNLEPWADALQRLQSSNFTGIDGMHDKVYASIRLSYDFLGSREDEAKSLLLLCALHKEDQEIMVDNLIRYSMGWDLLQDVKEMKQAKNRVNSLVDKLKSRCLLLDGESKNYVKMHDVIRDVCISIAKEDEHCMNNITSANVDEEFNIHERHKGSKVISCLEYDLDKLPEKLECPRLELLLLSGKPLKSISDYFFEQTRQLNVLSMSGSNLRLLPSSFHLLQNLQTLCLRGSSLRDIGVIGDLKNLKVLDLSWSGSIKRLPKDISELRRLQLLDLRGCWSLKVIEPNVISNLTKIEELYMPHTFTEWETEEGTMKERRNVSLIEIKSLQRLKILCLSIPSESVLPKGLFTEKLERYRISIGGKYALHYFENEISRWLRLNLSQISEIIAFGLESLMKRSEYLSLERLMDVNNVAPCLDKDGFPRLKHLILIQLTSLEKICHGKLPLSSFNELRKVEVRFCGKLKILFPFSVAKLLHEIIVEKCEMMEGIVSRGGENEGDDEAAHDIDESLQLRSLSLHSLPNIVQFYCSKLKTSGESSVHDYSKPLFSETVSLSNLEELTMSRMNIERIWPDQPLSSFDLQNLTSLTVENCNKIKYLFCFAMAERFVNLKKLKVHDCVAMKNILKSRKLQEERSSLENKSLFTNLEILRLSKLRVFETFCSEDSCIKEVSLDNDEEKIVPKQHLFNGMIAFPNLKELSVSNCNNLKYLLSTVMARSFVQLKKLKVSDCNNIEEVIVSDDESLGGSKEIIFEKLEFLRLQTLPNVIKFCDGDCIKCPLLSELLIQKCPKLKEFISNYMATKACTTSEEMGMMVAAKQNVFKDKVIFPNLKELTTDWSEAVNETFEINSSQSSSTISTFPNLSELNMQMTSRDKPIALSDVKLFLHKYHNIHTLRLGGSFVDGHEQQQPGEAYELINTATCLKTLIIRGADMLNHVFGDPEYAQPSHTILFQNLKYLTIVKCSRLQSLAPSFMSFHKLKYLTVRECHGLTYLFSYSTATTLVQLKQMVIQNCRRMREVISTNYYNYDEEGQTEAESEHHHFVFHKLETLRLKNLPNLKSFYSGNKVMNFPNLEELSVRGCLDMMSFSHGIISTSTYFNTIKIIDGIESWEGDVNTTVTKLWEDNSYLGLRRLFSHETDGDDDDQHCQGNA